MNKLFCMIGIHSWSPWVQTQKITIVAGKKNEYVSGYKYYYTKTCSCCNRIEHRMVRI